MPKKKNTSDQKIVPQPTIPTSFKLSKKSLTIILLIIVIALLYLFRGQLIVATVNGKPIFRWTLINELEKQSGKTALNSLVTKTLILQEAQKQKVTVTQEEINQEIKKLEESFTSQGQNLDQLLSVQGMTRTDLEEQIKIQKLVEKIVGQDISVSEQEINDYLQKNKDLLPKDTDMAQVKKDAEGQLKQQKLSEKVQSWVESLQTNAKINYLLRL